MNTSTKILVLALVAGALVLGLAIGSDRSDAPPPNAFDQFDTPPPAGFVVDPPATAYEQSPGAARSRAVQEQADATAAAVAAREQARAASQPIPH